MIRMGLLCSRGGSVAASAIHILQRSGFEIDAAVVTDRPCGAESMAVELGLRHKRIDYSSRDCFSKAAANWLLDECGMDWTCLLFSRLVSSHLYGHAPCVNIHPSLLPAFPGFSALRRARQSGARFFGATAHLVNELVDGGPILAQVVSPLWPELDELVMERISFAQKVYLLLLLSERMNRMTNQNSAIDLPAFDAGPSFASPRLASSTLAESFARLVEAEEIPWRA